MTKPIIEVKNLSKKYVISHDKESYYTIRDLLANIVKAPLRFLKGVENKTQKEDFWALNDVNFSVMPGETIGIIGRNGAGKSTLLKILSQITPPTAGSIHLRGRVASLLEVGTGFHPELTGRENIFLNGAILGMTQKEIKNKFNEIVEFAGIEKFLDTPVKRYSSGMYVRLAFSVAAHLEPEILIVDEVLAVGDAAFQKKCLGKMNEISKEGGRTVVFVSHNMAAIKNLCQKCIFVDRGAIIAIGETEEVISKYLDFSQENNERMDLNERIDRKGTQRIKFSDFKLERNNNIVEMLVTGEDAYLKIGYKSKEQDNLNNVNISVGIDNNSGERICLLSTDLTGQVYNNISPVGEFKIAIPKLPLCAGRYGVTLFMTLAGDITDWITQAAFFEVEGGDYFGTGKLPESQGDFLIEHNFN